MEMKVDSSLIKQQRERRAWSQEHLAEATGLGLRTIQRIEKTGAASYESARSLAAVFELDVADLRIADAAVLAPRLVLPLRPALGVLGAVMTGAALLFATKTFASDQVLMDVSVALSSTDETRALTTKIVVEDGTLVPDVNDLRLGELRFSIVPHVQEGGRILLEFGIYEQRGDEEVVVSEPRLIAMNGESAEVVIDADGARTLRLSVTAQVNPPVLPPTLRAR
jgi:transcriptional regulator with XRE-family HTH domain